MENNIVKVFREHFIKKIDDKLLKALFNFKINWLKKDENHIAFLGGNLFGPNPVIFEDNDRRMFFEIIGIDNAKELKVDINIAIALKEDEKREVASDEFNLAILWLCHEYSIYYKNDVKKYHEAVDLIYFIFAVKVFGSRYAKWFSQYKLDNDIAKVVYEKLSDKFLIKKYNNWQEVIQHLGTKLYSTEESGFDSRIKNLNTVDAMYIAADIHGSINSLIRNIYNSTLVVKASGEKIRSVSSIESNGEEETVREKIDNPIKYVTYMKDIVAIEANFIDFDVTDIVIHLFPKIKDKIFKQILQVISHSTFMHPDINEYFIEKPIVLSMDYLGTNKHLDYLDSIENTVVALKNYWSSSRIREKEAVIVKDKIRDFLKENTSYTTNHILSNIVLAVIMYVFLKAIKYR